ncbi:T9SS type A sorting domain-containing protein [bacterium]|nr:T9SS type A sorting domain-containing protein [bacterium]
MKNITANGIWLLLLIVLIAGSRAIAEVESGLVGYWHFDNNVLDASGFGHHGANYGALYDAGGMQGACIGLDGADDVIEISNADGGLTPVNTVSIEAWVRIRTYQTGYRDIFNSRSGLRLSVNDGYVAFALSGAWWSPHSFRLGKNQWTHICVTCDGNIKRLYIDGIMKSAESDDAYINASSSVLVGSPSQSLDAYLDEMKVYNRALVSNEVYQNYYTDKWGVWDLSLITFSLHYPNSSGIVLAAGDDAGIQWDAIPTAGQEVKIELLQGNEPKQILTASTPNDGFFSWRVSWQLDPGTDYRIRVSSVSNPDIFDTGNAFEIQQTGPAPLKKEARIYRVDASDMPVIDGIPGDLVWEFAQPESLVTGNVAEAYDVPWTQWQDNLVTWKGVWCAETQTLCLGIQVRDNIRGTFDNGPGSVDYSPENDESLEIYIDGDMSGGDYWGLFGPAQMFRVTGENSVDLQHYPDMAHSPSVYAGPGFSSAVTWGDAGDWFCEIEMTVYDALPGTVHIPGEGDEIGLDVWYNDSDDGVFNGSYQMEHQTGWAYHGKAWRNADEMGILSLGGDLNVPQLGMHMPGNWATGYRQEDGIVLSWESTPGIGYVQIDLYRGDVFQYTLAPSLPADSIFFWAIPADQEPGEDYRVRVTSLLYPALAAFTEYPFEILALPRLFWVTPADTGRTVWQTETTVTLNWNSQGEVGNAVSLSLVRNDAVVYEISESTENDGAYAWTIPENAQLMAGDFQVRVASTADPSVNALTGPVVDILATQHLDLVFPDDSGIVFHLDSTYQVLWDSRYTGALRIELFHADTLVMLISGNADADVPYAWHVPLDLLRGSGYAIRVTSLSDTAVHSQSVKPFDILQYAKIQVQSVSYESPVGTGYVLNMAWTAAGETGDRFTVMLYSGQNLIRILADSIQGLSYDWTVPENFQDAANCRIKVISCLDSTIYDYSESVFDIVTRMVQKSLNPVRTQLHSNYPNPFNPSTVIHYDLARQAGVRLSVFDILGRCLYEQRMVQDAGSYTFEWKAEDHSGRPLPGGVYFYRLEAGAYRCTRKMVVMR